MWRYILAAAITAVIMIAIYGPRSFSLHGADSDESSAETFVWTGHLAQAGWIHVRNTNGNVRVEPATGDSVEVTAQKKVRRGRGADVRFIVNRSDDDVYVCAVWGSGSRCGPSGYSSGSSRGRGLSRLLGGRSEVTVDFTVRVPQGVNADGSTVNGPIHLTGVRGETKARTVNGRIDLSDVIGPVEARSTNGAIRLRIDSLRAGAPINVRTTNGSVTAELPPELSADIELATTNGRIITEFPISTTGQISPRRVRGRIGEGGRELSIRTTNGSITLRPVPGLPGSAPPAPQAPHPPGAEPGPDPAEAPAAPARVTVRVN